LFYFTIQDYYYQSQIAATSKTAICAIADNEKRLYQRLRMQDKD